MEYSENTGNWLKILIEKLNMPSTAEFCRKAGLNRGLVDKLSKDMHSPRLDTLQKIKDAFPETNMNWLISGRGNVLEDVQVDDEIKLIELFRTKIKAEGKYEKWIKPLQESDLFQDAEILASEYALCDKERSVGGSFDFLLNPINLDLPIEFSNLL